MIDIFKKHSIEIAKRTLKLSDVGAIILGGMTKEEAQKVLKENNYSDKQIANLENRR